MPRRAVALLLAIIVAACAKMGPPPGGPEDLAAPRLLSRSPDSAEVLPNFRGTAEFVFDEVISEGSAPNFGLGSGSLEGLVILSPSPEVPVVRWRRNRITVEPREGWRDGLVYRVELRPGISDLRTNRWDEGAVITFTTGAVQPRTVLRGRIVDWTTRRPHPGGVVEAVLLPDSLSYRGVADSTGHFELGPLPAGDYLVYGGVDQSRNFRLEPRELHDTVRLAAGRDSIGEIWAFRHDTTGPRIRELGLRDSVSISITLTQPADPRQALTPEMVRVRRLPDSTEIPVVAVHAPAVFDSLFPPRPAAAMTAADSARADSLRAVRARADSLRADSVARAARLEAERAAEDARRGIVRRAEPRPPPRLEPLTSRPALLEQLLVRVDSILAPGGRYVVETRGLRNPNGAVTPGFLVLVVPELPPPRDTAAVRPDTGAVREPRPSLLRRLRQ